MGQEGLDAIPATRERESTSRSTLLTVDDKIWKQVWAVQIHSFTEREKKNSDFWLPHRAPTLGPCSTSPRPHLRLPLHWMRACGSGLRISWGLTLTLGPMLRCPSPGGYQSSSGDWGHLDHSAWLSLPPHSHQGPSGRHREFRAGGQQGPLSTRWLFFLWLS